MVTKFGSEEAVKEEMQRRQKVSRENYSGDGGFRRLKETDPERLKEIQSKGGRRAKK